MRGLWLSVAAETMDSVTNEPRLRETTARLFAEAAWIEREPVTPGNDPYKAASGQGARGVESI